MPVLQWLIGRNLQQQGSMYSLQVAADSLNASLLEVMVSLLTPNSRPCARPEGLTAIHAPRACCLSPDASVMGAAGPKQAALNMTQGRLYGIGQAVADLRYSAQYICFLRCRVWPLPAAGA